MTNLRDYLGCYLTDVHKSGIFYVSGAGCPLHDGSPYIIPGCKLHDNRPPPGTIIRKSLFNQYTSDQVVGSSLADLAAQFAAGHPSENAVAGPSAADGSSAARSALIPTVPNTPQSTPTRPVSGALTPTRFSSQLDNFDWSKICASANRYHSSGPPSNHSSSSSSDEEPPTSDPLELWGCPPPSPTESEYDWPTRFHANQGHTADASDTGEDVDSDFNSEVNPDDFDDDDYSRPPLQNLASRQPSSDVQFTHWYDTADFQYAEAVAATEINEARDRAAETAASHITALGIYDAATLAAYNAAKELPRDEDLVAALRQDMIAAGNVAASRAVEAAEASVIAACGQKYAEATGLDFDNVYAGPDDDIHAGPDDDVHAGPDDDNHENDGSDDGDRDADGYYVSPIPWASEGHWAAGDNWTIADQIRILGEPYSEYLEH